MSWQVTVSDIVSLPHMTEPETANRHASWLELFFDLVVVAAVAQLAHLLHGDAHHGPDALDIAIFFTLYLATWRLWTTFTLYSNVVAEKVHLQAMFVGMAGIATMAAAVPHTMDGRADVFAVAYLIANGIGNNTLLRSGRVLLSWTAVSRNAGLVPWVVSFWAENPWWKVGLWLFGLVTALAIGMLSGRADQNEILARMNANLAQRHRRDWRPWRRDDPVPKVEAAEVDVGHLGERLGLFVIIVLGEAVLQVVTAVSGIEDWRPGGGLGWLLLLTVASAFLLLIALWGLNVRHGFAEEKQFPKVPVLPMHFVMVASITTVAAGLGSAAAAFHEHLNAATTWLMCGGLTAFLLVVNVLAGHIRRWLPRVLAVLLPLVAAVLAPLLPAAVVVAALAVAAGGQLLALTAIRSDK
jgi:low temperature requirement protein LtrA